MLNKAKYFLQLVERHRYFNKANVRRTLSRRQINVILEALTLFDKGDIENFILKLYRIGFSAGYEEWKNVKYPIVENVRWRLLQENEENDEYEYPSPYKVSVRNSMKKPVMERHVRV